MANPSINSRQPKIDFLRAALDLDLEACDLKWTLFVAAAQSYRYDSQLNPYPSKYKQIQTIDRLDIESILRSIQSVPSLDSISWPNMPSEAVDLLFWVLGEQTEVIKIQSVPKQKVTRAFRTYAMRINVYILTLFSPVISQFAEIVSKVGSDYPAIQPTHVFEVVPNADSPAEKKFQVHSEQADSKSLYAFHGSKIDSFHSIVSHGLQQHLCKV